MRFIINVLLCAALLTYGFPAFLPGIHMYGGFWPEGIVCGLLFAVVGWALILMLMAFVVGTLGLGLVFAVVFRIAFPILQLKLMAAWFPHHLTVDSWQSAILGGLCFFVINWMLNSLSASNK